MAITSQSHRTCVGITFAGGARLVDVQRGASACTIHVLYKHYACTMHAHRHACIDPRRATHTRRLATKAVGRRGRRCVCAGCVVLGREALSFRTPSLRVRLALSPTTHGPPTLFEYGSHTYGRPHRGPVRTGTMDTTDRQKTGRERSTRERQEERAFWYHNAA